jgi:hypothetical protein
MADVKSMVYKGARVGNQAFLHTAVAADQQIQSLGFGRIMPKSEGGRVYRNQGNRIGTAGIPPGEHWSEFGFDGDLTFNEFVYILITIFGIPTVGTDGTNGKTWDFGFTLNSIIQRAYLSYVNGVGSDLKSVKDAFVDSLSIEMTKGVSRVSGNFKAGKRGTPSLVITVTTATTTPGETGVTEEVQTIDLSGGSDPLAGTWEITVPTFGTTVPLAFNAAAATVEAALDTVLGAGNLVTVGKVGFVYTLTFDDTLGNIGQSTVNADNLSAYATPTAITPQVLFSQNTNVFIATSHADLLTAIGTGVSAAYPFVVKVTLDIPSITNLIFRMNSSDESWYQPADLPIAATLKVQVGDDTDDDGVMAGYFAAATPIFIGVQNLGDAIAPDSQEEFLMVFSGVIIAPGEPDEFNGAATNTYTVELKYDATSGESLYFFLVNELAAV